MGEAAWRGWKPGRKWRICPKRSRSVPAAAGPWIRFRGLDEAQVVEIETRVSSGDPAQAIPSQLYLRGLAGHRGGALPSPIARGNWAFRCG